MREGRVYQRQRERAEGCVTGTAREGTEKRREGRDLQDQGRIGGNVAGEPTGHVSDESVNFAGAQEP